APHLLLVRPARAEAELRRVLVFGRRPLARGRRERLARKRRGEREPACGGEEAAATLCRAHGVLRLRPGLRTRVCRGKAAGCAGSGCGSSARSRSGLVRSALPPPRS